MGRLIGFVARVLAFAIFGAVVALTGTLIR